jgi:hypothetical protein
MKNPNPAQAFLHLVGVDCSLINPRPRVIAGSSVIYDWDGPSDRFRHQLIRKIKREIFYRTMEHAHDRRPSDSSFLHQRRRLDPRPLPRILAPVGNSG